MRCAECGSDDSWAITCECQEQKEDQPLPIDLSSMILGPCPVCFDHIKPCKCSLKERIAELELSLSLLLEASRPYLKRKGKVDKGDHKVFKKVHWVATRRLT